MSIINSFSLEYRFSKKPKKKFSTRFSRIKDLTAENKSSNLNSINIYNNNNNNNNNNINIRQLNRNKTSISAKIISVHLLDQLTSLGYKIDSIMALAKQTKFSTVEEALEYLERDPESNLYNHYFCPFNYSSNNSKCRICGNSISEHINDEESGNKFLNQSNEPNEQYFSIKENNALEEEKIIADSNKDSNSKNFNLNSNNNSIKNFEISNGETPVANGGRIFNNSNCTRNKSSFSPEYKSKRVFKMKANNNSNNNNNIANNNSSLLLLNNLNNENDKKPILDKLNFSNFNDIYNKNNNNNNSESLDCKDKDNSSKANKKKDLSEKQTINNISINIKEHFSNFNKGDTVNVNHPIYIRINTINSGKKSKLFNDFKELEITKNEKQSHTYTVPINRQTNSKNETNTIININDYYIEENNNNINNNTIESQNSKTKFMNNKKIPNYCKVRIPKETLQLFNNPELCMICCTNEVNKNNIAQEHCQHKFCDQCINTYITKKIMDGEVLEIKCIMVGCTYKYSQEEIKKNVSNEIFNKYKKFYRIQKKLKNPDKKYINCPFVDCEELVDCTNINEGNITCDKGHLFCRKCFKIGGHPNLNCSKEDIHLTFFKELKKNNSRGVSIRYKQCPECQILIEKIDGCNQMKCLNCGYVFCWLCLKEYTPNHFSLYNVNGCPGMRFETERTYKIRSSPCLNCIWHLFSCLLGVGMFILIFIFYIFCGCSYEFVKCYQNRNEQTDEESGISMNDYFDDRSANIHNRNSYLSMDRSRYGSNIYNTNNISRVDKNKLQHETKDNKYIIALLIFIGICCQPIYITFYVLYALIECYKRLNCLFYFPD